MIELILSQVSLDDIKNRFFSELIDSPIDRRQKCRIFSRFAQRSASDAIADDPPEQLIWRVVSLADHPEDLGYNTARLENPPTAGSGD